MRRLVKSLIQRITKHRPPNREMASEEPVLCEQIHTQLGNAPPQDSFDIAFSDNNPQITWKDRALSSGSSIDLKEVFSKFDLNCPSISSEILSRSRFLCAKYLGGAWGRTPANQFKIKAITGGMSNLLFLVTLPDDVKLIGSEPRMALLRIHCQGDLSQLLSESVVFTLLSERALGPKLLGVFPGGRFEQFIPSRPLQCLEISQPRFARLIAPMLARVHTLDVPITKEPEMLDTARGWLDKLRNKIGGNTPLELRVTKAVVDKNKVPTTFTCDQLAEELDFLQTFLDHSGSPIVFSHNDLQEGNILLFDDYTIEEDGKVLHNGQPSTVKEPLVLIDFEYCNYNYRGFDLGNHFCEYAFDYNCEEAPFYKIHSDKFEVMEERRTFAAAYIDEVYKMKACGDNPHFPSDLITGDRQRDLERVIEESILFMSLSNLFWVCWALWNAEEAFVQFDYGSYGRDRLALYFDAKHKLVDYLKKH